MEKRSLSSTSQSATSTTSPVLIDSQGHRIPNPHTSPPDLEGQTNTNETANEAEPTYYENITNFIHLHHVPRKELWKRLRGKTRERVPGVWESLKAIFFNSCTLNIFLIVIPFAWAAHFQKEWPNHLIITFILCFVSLIPLEKMFDFGGEQMSLYMGKDLGDLLVVTLNNTVEATLGIILLKKCDLKLLQSTLSGVVLLHLLLVPGVAFLTGGARIWQQNLHPHPTQLNQTLLTIGVLSLLIPTAFFAALNPSVPSAIASAATGAANILVAESSGEALINDDLRDVFLRISRGMSILLLIVYVCSRFFLYNPPGDGNSLALPPDAPEELRRIEHELAHEEPKINPWVGWLLLAVTVAITGVTAEFLVSSIETVLEESNITQEWFGLVLLPLVSFSGDATVAIVYFLRTILFLKPEVPESLAKARAIDLSIQFTLFWMPFLVLLGWWINKPLTLLFDQFEVSVLIGACFLVNYVTADSKTNWAEGVILCAFYIMIVLTAWYYPGQLPIRQLLACPTVAEGLAEGVSG
ncbi:hypothetical protein M422DRAFT_35554 [Sphaerobolus stellatus SS14]|uniref:Sodium/calcium exchanger membrane region domain-containing protein n=1 Tax=Sphaerobolus stellatus (strain SS14) TaxID=990650 RepID=A0A0C9TSB7_SPHS4|nr:hypothetical protein M422DRAFT_35554 [Sphaerobolus stellatus SS14]